MTDRRNERNFTELEVGGWYQDEAGFIDEICGKITDTEGLDFIATNGRSYKSNGDHLRSGREHSGNLIRRVKVVDWDAPINTSDAQPVNLADKLASEMTMRQYIMVEMMKANIISNPDSESSRLAKLAIADTTALINAMERGTE